MMAGIRADLATLKAQIASDLDTYEGARDYGSYSDKSGCQYCDGYCHGGCREEAY